ncbi:MAG: DUF4168 domain-containing protein [Rhodospirillales bacterium]|nr:DUF4168 domain-containing protein [Rhodospirillales bacterium]
MFRCAVIIIIASLIGMPVAPETAHAQSDTGAAAGQTGAGAGSFQLTEEKLEAFVDVAVRIGRMKKVWEPRIRGARTRAEATKYQDAAVKQMLAIIEGAPGISMEEYMGIAQAAQADDALARVIADMIETAP